LVVVVVVGRLVPVLVLVGNLEPLLHLLVLLLKPT
jgi:hypothetical protein